MKKLILLMAILLFAVENAQAARESGVKYWLTKDFSGIGNSAIHHRMVAHNRKVMEQLLVEDCRETTHPSFSWLQEGDELRGYVDNCIGFSLVKRKIESSEQNYDIYECAEDGRAQVFFLVSQYRLGDGDKPMVDKGGNPVLRDKWSHHGSVQNFDLSKRGNITLLPRLTKTRDGKVPGMCASETCVVCCRTRWHLEYAADRENLSQGKSFLRAWHFLRRKWAEEGEL